MPQKLGEFPKKEWKKPLRVFYSYSHQDADERKILAQQLSALERNGLITTWYDRMIPPGEKWQPEIRKEMEEADVFLFLVSAGFISSDYCYEVEFGRAEERYEQAQCRIIPVSLKPCLWPENLRQYQSLAPLDQAITTFPNPDVGYCNVASGLKRTVEDLLAKAPKPLESPVPLAGKSIEIPRDLPFLCNRLDQIDSLKTSLKVSSTDRRPVVLITCGSPKECHEAFLERISRSPLPTLLGLDKKPLNAFPDTVDWPTVYSEGKTPQEIFESRVTDRLSRDTRLPEGITILESNVYGRPGIEKLLEAYLSYWESWPPLKGRRALVVSVSLKYEPGAFDFSALKKNLNVERWPKIRVVVTEELKPIPREYAENWAGLKEVREYYPRDLKLNLLAEIGKMYQGNEMPMDQLAVVLLEAVRKVSAPNYGRPGMGS